MPHDDRTMLIGPAVQWQCGRCGEWISGDHTYHAHQRATFREMKGMDGSILMAAGQLEFDTYSRQPSDPWRVIAEVTINATR